MIAARKGQSFSSRCRGSILLVCSLAAISCGDDSQPQPTDGGFRDGEVIGGKPKPTRDRCYSAAASFGEDAGPSTHARCLCDQCLVDTSACFEDPGCMQIYTCMERTGCQGLDDCYFGKAPCRDEITQLGVMSLPFTLAQDLGRCAVETGCSVVDEPQCRVVGEFTCDGDEDCPGKHCCAHFNGVLYDGSSCEKSCDVSGAADAAVSERSTQMCHAGQECSKENESCRSYELLPDFLARCEDTGTPAVASVSSAAGEVSCGSAACGAGEKCCVRTPKKPYCAPEGERCECKLPTDMVDAGPPDAAIMSMDDSGAEDAGH